MADVNAGADADISPGLFWGNLILREQWGFHDRVARDTPVHNPSL